MDHALTHIHEVNPSSKEQTVTCSNNINLQSDDGMILH